MTGNEFEEEITVTFFYEGLLEVEGWLLENGYKEIYEALQPAMALLKEASKKKEG